MLEGFLSELLKDDIIIETIPESECNQQIDRNKFKRVDKEEIENLFCLLHLLLIINSSRKQVTIIP